MHIETKHLSHYIQDKNCTHFALCQNIEQPETDEVYRGDFYQIILLRKGSGTLFVDFQTYPFEAGMVAVLFPKQLYALHTDSDIEVSLVKFDKTIFCSEILANELKDYNIDLQKRINCVDLRSQPQAFDRLLRFTTDIQDTAKSLNLLRMMQIKFLIKIMIMHIIDHAPASSTSPEAHIDAQLYRQFREMVDAQYKQNRIVSEYAQQLHISSKKLTFLCNEFAGMSPLKIIHEKVNLEIQKILLEEESSMKEISYQLGFSSQAAFNKYVDTQFGKTPNELQKHLHQIDKNL